MRVGGWGFRNERSNDKSALRLPFFLRFFVTMNERMRSYKWIRTCAREPNVSMKRRKGAFWAEEEPSKRRLERLVDHLELGPEVRV